METDNELKKLINDTIKFVNDLYPAWGWSMTDKLSIQHALDAYVNWRSDEAAVISCYDMLNEFGLQSSDKQQILNFMLNDSVIHILDNAE